MDDLTGTKEAFDSADGLWLDLVAHRDGAENVVTSAHDEHRATLRLGLLDIFRQLVGDGVEK